MAFAVVLYVEPAPGPGGPILKVPSDSPEELFRELVALTGAEPFAPAVFLTFEHVHKLREMSLKWRGADLIHAQVQGLGGAKVWLGSPTVTSRN